MSVPPSAHLVTRLSNRNQLCSHSASCLCPCGSATQHSTTVVWWPPCLTSSHLSLQVSQLKTLTSWHGSFHLPLRCHHGTQTPSDPRPGSRHPDSAVLRLLPPVPHTCFVTLPWGHQCGSSDLSLPLRGLFYTRL